MILWEFNNLTLFRPPTIKKYHRAPMRLLLQIVRTYLISMPKQVQRYEERFRALLYGQWRVRDQRRPTVHLNVILSYDLTGIHRPYLVLSTDNKEASPSVSEVSGPDCMGMVDVDAETSTEVGAEVLGTSIWAVAST